MIYRILSILLFSPFLFGDQVDELEDLLLNHPDLIIHPEKLYKSDGLWISEITDAPFTGRVEIYLQDVSNKKVLECTLVKGLKHGIFIQYYDHLEKFSGIIGLYMEDMKEGGWVITEPMEGWANTTPLELTKNHKITYISYRDGLRDGSVKVSDFLNGRYFNGKKTGTWFFFNDSDNKDIWTEKHYYDEDELLQNECREIIDGNIFNMDCDKYAKKYTGSRYLLIQLDPKMAKKEKIEESKRIVIQDVNGRNVEIIANEFLGHIKHYHTRKMSIHKERGYAFKVNDALRNMLRNITED